MLILSSFVTIICLFQFIETLPQVTELPNYTKLTSDQIRHLQNRGFGPTVPSYFAPTVDDSTDEEEASEDSSVAATQQRTQAYSEDYNYPNTIVTKPQRFSLREQQHQSSINRPTTHNKIPIPIRQQQGIEEQKINKEEEEEEIEEPDRLSLLLPQSKFVCDNKNTGYYADEDLGCEVFHYCQDNAKHSWICPDGFTFHQVHLICMPPSGDNICAKSSQYHFVNDYLYKPVNLEEHQQKPNTSLRYSERYYPDTYYQQDNEEEQPQVHNHKQHSVRVNLQDIPIPRPLLVEQVTRTTFRPETSLGQVFRSPNEVNIPLQQRRPQYIAQRFLNRE